MLDIEFVRSRFIKHFDGKTGNVYTSPGRINLIGEHTDYNGGFVFPGAVDKGILAEMRANGTEDTVMAYAIDLKDRVDFKLSDPDGPRASWARYIYGIALEMKKLGVPVKGFNIAFAGDVPLGAGMSSSAAMESCFAFGLNDIFGDNKDIALKRDMADEILRFATRRAVANGNSIHFILQYQTFQLVGSQLVLGMRRMRIDGLIMQEFALFVQNHQFAARTKTWVEGQHCLLSQRRSHQQLAQIGHKHLDSFRISLLFIKLTHLRLHLRLEQAFIRIRNRH